MELKIANNSESDAETVANYLNRFSHIQSYFSLKTNHKNNIHTFENVGRLS